ncbi:MAG: hypothetical protein KGL04_00020, partial [Elusimicrobia bacterium]|nr:hypothetical protein [Elusimicrobiota bacterium]
ALDGVRLLLYAREEWGDAEAGAAAERALRDLPRDNPAGLPSFKPGTPPSPDEAARLAPVFWGAADLLSRARALTEFLAADGSAGALGAEAFLCAAAAGAEGAAWLERTRSALEPLEAPHASLGEASARISALCGLFQITADPALRRAADSLARGLFQDLWERERGGFMSRAPQNGAAAPPVVPEENAAAFEAVWRLHHVTGNPNYRKWLAWGLKGLAADARALPAAKQAGLARVADMMARGRLYLELVGRPEDEKARALALAALARHSPRRVLSWISPDDRDYVMAHKLSAPEYPALFACADLKPVAFAQRPEEVPALFGALSSAPKP